MIGQETELNNLLTVLQKAFPDAISYEIENNIVQANAEGFSLQVQSKNHNSTNIFVKKVDAHKYAHKKWDDLRRTLLYARTESRFYSTILPLLKEKSKDLNWTIAPTCHCAESNLFDLIEEHESTSAKSVTDDDPDYSEDNTSILHGKGGLLILDSLNRGFYQTSPLNPLEAIQCLKAIARFHAMAFQDKDILKRVSENLCEYGGSYHLANRNPKELKDIEQTWSNFSNEISCVKPDLFEQESIQNLGKRIKVMAELISNELSPAYDDDYATIVHGDFKSMNVFIPSDDSNAHYPIMIDFASTGIGNGMSDVAMHITHALHPNDLVNGGEEKLVDVYIDAMYDALDDRHLYPRHVAKRHYKLATLDYFRFVLGRLWRGVTLEKIEKSKDSKNSVFVNRNIDAAIYFIERADKYLTELETEM
jgi:hypothetical protein